MSKVEKLRFTFGCGVNAILVLQEEGSDDLVVDEVAAAVLARDHEPEEEEALGQRVQRDPEEQLIAEELQDAE